MHSFLFSAHDIYVSPDGTGVAVVETGQRSPGYCKAIVWSSVGYSRNVRVLIPAGKPPLPALEAALPNIKFAGWTKVKQAAADKALMTFEARECAHFTYKVGILYANPGGLSEDELYSAKGGSPVYDEFLAFIGEKIALQGWDKFRGGLDVTSNTTGTHSVYTTLGPLEIMFHVCTLLPWVENDQQKLERKRHLGNDFVTVVFFDPQPSTSSSGTPAVFDPSILTSQFTQVVIVVTPILDSDGKCSRYSINVATKSGISPFPPFLNDSGIYPKDEATKKFLLTKSKLYYLYIIFKLFIII